MRFIVGDLHDGLPEKESRIGPFQVAANTDIALQIRPRPLPSKSLVIFHITFYHSTCMFAGLSAAQSKA